eukprot:TRINITY_DN3614_c0_g1_i1.p1 TRINITY_DN3614_c0_g1~~TRINITY_DN3614_c0_g1_i1.p1  ORF type:complete len:267 (+),score=55.55 TRINITY_DN3614_c0_g1_i1:47-847(+)
MPRQIIWITGHPTSGKTFQGDYMAQELGFHHVDGDKALLNEETKAIGNDLYKFYYNYVFKGMEAPEKLWVPYHNLICSEIFKDAEMIGEDMGIVVSLSNYSRKVREYCREMIMKHFGDKIVFHFIHLGVLPEQFAERNLRRYKDYCQIQDIELHKFWEETLKKGPYTTEEAALRTLMEDPMLKGYDAFCEETDRNDLFIPTGADHSGVVAKIHSVVGAPPPLLKKVTDPDFIKAIAKIQHDRVAAAKEFLAKKLDERVASQVEKES